MAPQVHLPSQFDRLKVKRVFLLYIFIRSSIARPELLQKPANHRLPIQIGHLVFSLQIAGKSQ